MPISHKHKAIYVHIPKCGGSSIEQAMDIFQKKECLFFCQGDKHNGIPLQHLTALAIQQEVSRNVFLEYFTFAVVRDPLERFVSECAYRNRTDYDIVLQQAIAVYNNPMIQYADFYAHIRPQSEYLVDADNNIIVDYICALPELNKKWNEIVRNMLVLCLPLQKINVTSHPPAEDILPPALIPQIKDFYKADYELFANHNIRS